MKLVVSLLILLAAAAAAAEYPIADNGYEVGLSAQWEVHEGHNWSKVQDGDHAFFRSELRGATNDRISLMVPFGRQDTVVHFRYRMMPLERGSKLTVRFESEGSARYEFSVAPSNRGNYPGTHFVYFDEEELSLVAIPDLAPTEDLWHQVKFLFAPHQIRIYLDDMHDPIAVIEDHRIAEFSHLSINSWRGGVDIDRMHIQAVTGVSSAAVDDQNSVLDMAKPSVELYSTDGKQARVTLINQSPQPVYADTVRLPAAAVYQALDLPAGNPISAATVCGHLIPTYYHEESDAVVLSIALQGGERKDILLQPADDWSGSVYQAVWDDASASGWISNGIVRVDYGPGGFDVSYDGISSSGFSAQELALLRRVNFTGWLAEQGGGLTRDVEGMQVIDTRVSRSIVAVDTFIDRGSLGFAIQRRFSGFAEDVLLTETVSLLRHQPVVRYQLEFANQGQRSVYIAWAQGHLPGPWVDGNVTGEFAQAQHRLQYPYQDGVTTLLRPDNLFFRPQWNRESWASVSPVNHSSIGFSTLIQLNRGQSQNHFMNTSRWVFNRNSFSLVQTAVRDGHFPIEIRPGTVDTIGMYFVVAPPGMEMTGEMESFYSHLSRHAIPPDARLDDRLAFARQYSVFWEDNVLQGARTDRLETLDPNRWVNTTGNVVGVDGQLVLASTNGAAEAIAALVMDFGQKRTLIDGNPVEDVRSIVFRPGLNITTEYERPVVLDLYVAALSDASQFSVGIRTLEDQTRDKILLEANEAGAYTVNVSEATDWRNPVPFILTIRHTGPAGSSTSLSRFSLRLSGKPGPVLLSPVDDLDMTDSSSYFKWESVEGAVRYELQLAEDRGFGSANSIMIDSTLRIGYYFPEEVFSPGVWYWRMRAVDEEQGETGEWSEVRRLSVNDVHAHAELIRPVSHEAPLFTLEVNNTDDLRPFRDSIPEDIRPYTAINVNNKGYGTQGTAYLRSLFEELDEDDTNFYIIRANDGSLPRSPGTVALSDVEWLFQNYPNVIGIWAGETFWSFFDDPMMQEYVSRSIQLCAKYGRLYIWSDGNGSRFRWQQLADDPYWGPFMREHRDYLVFSQKNNIGGEVQHTTQGALMGMWLSDMIGHLGHTSEVWYWVNAGFGALGQYVGEKGGLTERWPRSFYSIPFVTAMAQGATVFSVDGQQVTRNVGAQTPATIWGQNGQTTPTFDRYIAPLIRTVVQNQLIPSREQVLEQLQLAVVQTQRLPDQTHRQEYGPYESLYRETYGLRHRFEYIPNTGRFYFIPLLPYGVEGLGAGIRSVALSELADALTVRQLYHQYYPDWYEGDAFVSRVGDSLFILNTHENRDIVESFSVPLHDSVFHSLAGEVNPHTYIVGKLEADGRTLRLHVNTEYLDRVTHIRIGAETQPAVTVASPDAVATQRWDAEAGLLHLTLSHRAVSGAVDLLIGATE